MVEQSNLQNVLRSSSTPTGVETTTLNKLAWNWNISSTVKLIITWRDCYAELKSTKRNSIIYKRMASELSKTLGLQTPLTGSQIQTKINNLRKQFRRENLLVGPSSGTPSKWWAYDLIAAIIGGEASLDNDLLSQSKDFSSQDILDSQILKHNEDTVNILDLKELDTADNVQTSISIPIAEPVASASEETINRNKRLSFDNMNSPNKKTKTEELEDLLEANDYWRRSMKNIMSGLKSRNSISLSSMDCEASSQSMSLLNLVPMKLNFQESFSSEYLKIANKFLEIQVNSLELREREIIARERECTALERMSKAIENASQAQERETAMKIEYYKFLMEK